MILVYAFLIITLALVLSYATVGGGARNHVNVGGASGEAIGEIHYRPGDWNCPDNCQIQHSHNCYTYVLNDLHPEVISECEERKKTDGKDCNDMFHQPGFYHQKYRLGKKISEITPNGGEMMNCARLLGQVKKDNDGIIEFSKPKDGHGVPEQWGAQDKCPDGYYMGALTIDPGRMYHFYRRDQWDPHSGKYYWSHKDGGAKATNLDSSGRRITDPNIANRKYSKYNYSEVCPYFCLPQNNVKQTRSDHRSQDGV